MDKQKVNHFEKMVIGALASEDIEVNAGDAKEFFLGAFAALATIYKSNAETPVVTDALDFLTIINRLIIENSIS